MFKLKIHKWLYSYLCALFPATSPANKLALGETLLGRKIVMEFLIPHFLFLIFLFPISQSKKKD